MSNKLNKAIINLTLSKTFNDKFRINQVDKLIEDLVANGQPWGKLSGLPSEWFATIFELFSVKSPVTFYRPAIYAGFYKDKSIGLLMQKVIDNTKSFASANYEDRKLSKTKLNDLYVEISNVLYYKYKGK